MTDGLKRRDLLMFSAVTAAGLILPTDDAEAFLSFRNKFSVPEKTLKLTHAHTGESLSVTYWSHGRYVYSSMQQVRKFLRDFRTGDTTNIDPRLLDQLFAIQQLVKPKNPFLVYSGFRSQKTNKMLRNHSDGVAKNSFHLYGKAIDITAPGTRLNYIAKAAKSLNAGGVGYYPDSGFVHLDTGKTRSWST